MAQARVAAIGFSYCHLLKVKRNAQAGNHFLVHMYIKSGRNACHTMKVLATASKNSRRGLPGLEAFMMSCDGKCDFTKFSYQKCLIDVALWLETRVL